MWCQRGTASPTTEYHGQTRNGTLALPVHKTPWLSCFRGSFICPSSVQSPSPFMRKEVISLSSPLQPMVCTTTGSIIPRVCMCSRWSAAPHSARQWCRVSVPSPSCDVLSWSALVLLHCGVEVQTQPAVTR